MHKEAEKISGEPIMTVSKSILYKTLKTAISQGEDESIRELADILHGSMLYHLQHETQITANSTRLDTQHGEILNSIEAMREGFRLVEKRFEQVDKRFEQVDKRFEQMDKRFDDLIHQFDKRFDQVDKRFAFQSWLIGIGFVSVNTLVVLLKLFS